MTTDVLEPPSKFSSVESAIRRIQRGRRMLIGSGAAEPQVLVEGLVRHKEHFADNEIVHLLTLGPAPYVQPGMEQHFRHTAFFIGANVREAIQEGRADFMPVFLSEIPRLMRTRRVRIDAALIQVSPPDRHGYVSLGVSVDIVRAAVETAGLILAEINPQMPRTHGDSFLHVDRIHALVEADYSLPEILSPPPDETFQEMGRHVAALIPNGATLQMGIGKLPDAVLAALSNHRNLGVHTEMFSDGVMKLVEGGVVNGRRKTLLPGKVVTSFLFGSEKLYRWADDNPALEMRDSSFTNDPVTIARNERMVAINAALAVDLTGQVAADTLMGRFFSGIGGQVDFIRGASRSQGGRPIIALPSTAKGGEVSRIQPALEEGAGIVTSRGDVRYVVTEFGAADLWGKNIRQRAMALIDIAHPDHRPELLSAAKKRRYIFADQLASRASYPWEEAGPATLSNGQEVMVRPVRVSDEEALQDLFYTLSDESTYRRFLCHKTVHTRREMQQLVALDYEQNLALLVTVEQEGHEVITAMARYDVDHATRLADIAFVVRDEWQRKGIGALLMRRMAEIAKARGLRGFTADVLGSNKPMLMVFHKCGMKVESKVDGESYHLTLRFDDPARPTGKPA
jgi:acyl-CoA hydrolase/GNAT superfamily N-acetyltransferase